MANSFLFGLLVTVVAVQGGFSGETAAVAAPAFPGDARTVMFLGDSITAAGHYIAVIEAHLRQQQVAIPEFINLGLPSETCTGLSEPDHPFPRPNVHERLQRALEKVKPDLVVACYGMNDGIYYPFDEDRFKAYQTGVKRLIRDVKATGAKLVLLTPPPFDSQPFQKQGKLLPADAPKFSWFAIYQDYDEVIRRYAEWVKQQRDQVDLVVDLYTPIAGHLADERSRDPAFTMSADGVHLNEEGHRLIATAILQGWGHEAPSPRPSTLKLVSEKTQLLHAAWLNHVGHQRPGVAPGLPIEQAKAKAAQLMRQIEPN